MADAGTAPATGRPGGFAPSLEPQTQERTAARLVGTFASTTTWEHPQPEHQNVTEPDGDRPNLEREIGTGTERRLPKEYCTPSENRRSV